MEDIARELRRQHIMPSNEDTRSAIQLAHDWKKRCRYKMLLLKMAFPVVQDLLRHVCMVSGLPYERRMANDLERLAAIVDAPKEVNCRPWPYF